MSIGFNWFRTCRISHRAPDTWYDWYELEFLDGDSTSHSAGNIIIVQDLIEKYGNKRIPYIYEEFIDSLDYDLGLIEPREMYEICQKILSDTEVDEVDMRHRIEWFMELSKKGYYLAYIS